MDLGREEGRTQVITEELELGRLCCVSVGGNFGCRGEGGSSNTGASDGKWEGLPGSPSPPFCQGQPLPRAYKGFRHRGASLAPHSHTHLGVNEGFGGKMML